MAVTTGGKTKREGVVTSGHKKFCSSRLRLPVYVADKTTRFWTVSLIIVGYPCDAARVGIL
jgi:hypothetical protein